MAKKNTGLILVGSAAVLGVGGYLIYRHLNPSPATPPAVPAGQTGGTLTPGAYTDPATGKNMEQMTETAVTLASIGQTRAGSYWAAIVRAHNPTAAQASALTAVGYP